MICFQIVLILEFADSAVAGSVAILAQDPLAPRHWHPLIPVSLRHVAVCMPVGACNNRRDMSALFTPDRLDHGLASVFADLVRSHWSRRGGHYASWFPTVASGSGTQRAASQYRQVDVSAAPAPLLAAVRT